MNLFRFILVYIKYLLHISSITLRHSGRYLKFLANIQITFISDLIINLNFFLYGIFIWFFSKVGELKYPTYLSSGSIKKRHFIQAVQSALFRGIHRKKHRKTVRLAKIVPMLNYFGGCSLSSLELSKIFASISIFIMYVGLLFLFFKYLNYYLKRQTLNFLNTGIQERETVVQILRRYYIFVKILNTLDLIKTFITRKKIYRRVIRLFSFIKS